MHKYLPLTHMMRVDLTCFVWKSGRSDHCAMQYFALVTVSFKTTYTRFDGFSTPGISFWLICTTRRWDRGSVWGHTLFLSELIFFSIHAKTHFASPWRPRFDSRCEPCIVPKKIVNVFCLPTKILWETQLFFRSFKTVISSTNSGSHCLSRKCRTYTFNNFSLAKWESRNGGDLFGRAKIDTAKSCIQLLQIVLLYRGHLYKELCPGIFRYSKEWKSFTIDIVPKSA
jgi:hypothetical protein